MQRLRRTLPHHAGPSVQTHEPALHCGAAGGTPTQRRHRLDHHCILSPNKPEVTLSVTPCFHVFISVSSESLIWFVNQFFLSISPPEGGRDHCREYNVNIIAENIIAENIMWLKRFKNRILVVKRDKME